MKRGPAGSNTLEKPWTQSSDRLPQFRVNFAEGNAGRCLSWLHLPVLCCQRLALYWQKWGDVPLRVQLGWNQLSSGTAGFIVSSLSVPVDSSRTGERHGFSCFTLSRGMHWVMDTEVSSYRNNLFGLRAWLEIQSTEV